MGHLLMSRVVRILWIRGPTRPLEKVPPKMDHKMKKNMNYLVLELQTHIGKYTQK